MDTKLIGSRIRQYREAAHITQEALANAVGCTPQHIGAIERGIKTPRLDTFIAIANTLGVSADLLLKDVLDVPTDWMAAEFSAATAELNHDLKVGILRAVRSFADYIG